MKTIRQTTCLIMACLGGFCLSLVTGVSPLVAHDQSRVRERISELRSELHRIERKLGKLEARMERTPIPSPTRDPSEILSGVDVYPGSIEPVLEPEGEGWVGQRIYRPEVAQIQNNPFLIFSTRGNYPGEQGLGYVKLSENGLPDGPKNKLVTMGSYEFVRGAEYVPPADTPRKSGTLYAADYYVTRAGQWATYLTKRPIKIDGDELSVSSAQTVLTGNGKQGHWMARSVNDPELVSKGDSRTLFFRAKTYPNPSPTQKMTISSLSLTNGHVSKPLLDPDSREVLWNPLPSGYSIVPLSNQRLLLIVTNYDPSGIDSLEAVIFRDRKPIAHRTLLDSRQLQQHLANDNYAGKLRINMSYGLDLTEFHNRKFLYMALELNDSRHAIYRIPITFPPEF